MTNRELLQKAMPLFSLSSKQWDMLVKHIEVIGQTDINLYNALNKLLQNQAKIEIMDNYLDYFYDDLNSPVNENSVTGLLQI